MYLIRFKDIYFRFNVLPQETVPTKKAFLRHKQLVLRFCSNSIRNWDWNMSFLHAGLYLTKMVVLLPITREFRRLNQKKRCTSG